MIGFLALLLINAVLFVAQDLINAARMRFPDATPEDPQGPRSQEGDVIPVVFGTVRLSANVVVFSNTLAVEQTEKIKTGIFSSRRVTTGYSYEALMQVLLCHGPVQELIDIVWQDSKSLGGSSINTVYEDVTSGGSTAYAPVTSAQVFTTPALPILAGPEPSGVSILVNAPDLFGGVKHGGGAVGPVQMYWGLANQIADGTLKEEFSPTTQDLYGVDYVPKYNGISYLMLGVISSTPPHNIIRFNFGEFGSVPALNIVVRRCPSALGLSGAQTNINGGSNIAECAYELLTNTVWGMKIPADQIDMASFVAAGVVIAEEGFGFHMSLTSQNPGATELQEMMRYADGQIQQHPITGLLEFTLNRDDYVIETLPHIDESAASGATLTRPSWSELKNEVKVVYTRIINGTFKQTTTQPIQDIAAQRNFGTVNTVTIQYPAVMNSVLANKLGTRDLRKLSTPLAQIKGLRIDRRAADFRVGRPFVLSWAQYGIATHVFRVVSVDYGTIEDGAILVDAVEDIFALEHPFYANPVDPDAFEFGFGPRGIVKVTPVVTKDASTGYLELVLVGGEGRVTAVQFREQSGNAPLTAWHNNTALGTFSQTVDLDEKHPSLIAWQILGTLLDETSGVMADGEIAYPIATLPARPNLSSTVHSTGFADVIIDADQDAVGVKIAVSYDHIPTIDEVIATPTIDLVPGEFRLTIVHAAHLDAEHPVAYASVVLVDSFGNWGPVASITINAIRPEQYTTPSPTFGPIETEDTSFGDTEEACVHVPIVFEFNTERVDLYARESDNELTGARPPDIMTNMLSYTVTRHEGIIAEADDWRTEVDIATRHSRFRRVWMQAYGPTGLRGDPFTEIVLPADVGTGPTNPPTGITVVMSSVAGLARATVTWVNGDALAYTRVERNGIILARMAPGVTTLVDDGLSPDETYTYSVHHIRNGQTSGPAGAADIISDAPTLVAPVWDTGYPQSAGYDSTAFSPPPNGLVRVKGSSPDSAASVQVWMNDQETLGGSWSLKETGVGVIDTILNASDMGSPNPTNEIRWFRLVAVRAGYVDSAPSESRSAAFGYGV